jgi:hypothetical protein
VSTVIASIAALRQRFELLRRQRPRGRVSLVVVGQETGTGRMTLERFLRGSNLTIETLAVIEQWCDEEESRQRRDDARQRRN